MRVKITKSKNAESFYIIKSYRNPKSGKSTSKIVEKLGTKAELKERLGEGVDIMGWAKERAKELTLKEKEATRKVMVGFSPIKQIDSLRKSFNGGYLFLQDICSSLGIASICKEISESGEFSFDLEAILSCLIFGRILEPGSKRALSDFSKSLIEDPSIQLHQIYRALEVLAKKSDMIQAKLYENSKRFFKRSKGILYYDCTNFFFEIEHGDNFRCFGPSKEHRPNPIVQMGLFMDKDGIPLAFCITSGNQSEQKTLIPLERQILEDFKLSKFVVITDAGLSSQVNRKFNSVDTRQFITTQSVKKLKGHLKTWALDADGWSCSNKQGIFNLEKVAYLYDKEDTDELIKSKIRSLTFYKCRSIKEKGSDGAYFEQRLIVTFSFKHRDYQRSIRDAQLERAHRAISTDASRINRKGNNDFRRLCKKTSLTKEGEVAEIEVWDIDKDKVFEEEQYDGFYALCTSLQDDDIATILSVSSRRWEIEESFRIMKSEFKARPVYLSREDRIKAHFLTCFIALLVYRLLDKKLEGRFSCTQLIDTLKEMNFMHIPGEGWIPTYARTEITDALHEAFNFRTDYEIIPESAMRKIIRQTKKP